MVWTIHFGPRTTVVEGKNREQLQQRIDEALLCVPPAFNTQTHVSVAGSDGAWIATITFLAPMPQQFPTPDP